MVNPDPWGEISHGVRICLKWGHMIVNRVLARLFPFLVCLILDSCKMLQRMSI